MGLGAGGESLENALVGDEAAFGVQGLNADVAGAGVEVCLNAIRDGLFVAPRDESVDELVASTVLEVGVQ